MSHGHAAAAATRVRKIALSPASTSGGWGSQAAADRARSTRSPQRPTSDYWPGVTKPVVRGRVELPTFRFSGVADVQLRGRCGSVDGCRRVPLVAAGCRRCRHRCRQLAGHPAASRSSAGLQPGSRSGSARQKPHARRVWPSGARGEVELSAPFPSNANYPQRNSKVAGAGTQLD
jgi:hypothetical protein